MFSPVPDEVSRRLWMRSVRVSSSASQKATNGAWTISPAASAMEDRTWPGSSDEVTR
jgi:hypothetical protein